jgi:PAS domain S-box-containing protein
MNTDSNRPLNSTPAVGIILQIADGCIQSCNHEAERILGYTTKQLIEANYFDPPWQTIHQDGSIFSATTHPGISSLKTGQPNFNVVMGFYKPDGDLVWLSIATQPLFQANSSQAYAVVVSFTKITEFQGKKPALAALETNRPIQNQSSQRLKLLLIEDNPIDRAMYRRYLQKATENQYDFVEAESGEEALEIARESQPDLILLDYLLPDMDGLEWLNLWQQQQGENRPPVIALTGQGDESIAVQFLKLGAADYLTKSQLTPEKFNLEVKQVIAEYQLRTQHQETLLKLQLATVASGLGMWFWDLINDKLEWTEQCKALFGLAPNTEISYQLFLNTLHPEDRDRTDTSVKQVLSNKTEYNIEYRVIWSDGSLHWLAAKGKGFYNQHGEAVRMMGTVQDVTGRKQIEQCLLDSNRRITDIMESMTDAFYTLDCDFKFTYLNQEAQRILYKSQEQLLGKSIWSKFSSLVGTEFERQFRQTLAEQTTTRFEYYYPPFDRWYEIAVYPSTHGLSIYFRDITDSKLAAIRLQKNERLLKLALSSAKAGSWDWEISTGKVIWSPENYDLYGLESQTELLAYQDWENSLHPEDRDKVNQEVEEVLSGQLAEFRTEYRTIHPQKGLRWLLGIGNVTRNNQGEPIRMSGINLDITERKQIEEALRNSEYRVRKILDSLIIFAGIITTDGEVIEVNQAALNSVSLQPEDILHQKFCETYWWSHSPEIKAKLEDAIQRAAKGESVRFDIVGRVRDNKFILIDFSIIPVFNADGEIEYLIPSGIDVSDREASKQALKESEDELRLITEIIPQQIWTASPTGETDYINQRWQEYTGLSLEPIKAQGWSTIVHPDDLPQVTQAWNDSIKSGKKYDLEARLRGADGIYRWFLGRARPLRNPEGKILKWYGTNTDITLIKNLEEKLWQQTKDLTEANRLKDEFLAIVSHELRTPLNPILGWSQLLAMGRLDADKTAQGIEIIQRNAKLQSQLIDDLLDVSRILRGKLDLKISAINLESVIRSAVATVQLAAEAKSIQILTELNPNIGQVSGDAGRLQQIVWNLLSNAIKFTPEGGQITVKLERVGNQAQIQVQDTGQGISADFLPYVFDRFRQAESATTRKFGGLGLGLAIVRHITEIHGGIVSVTSPGEGNGATFSVQLPLINTLTTKQPDSNLVNEPVKNARLEGIKILVVEDEIDSRDILTFVLKHESAEVISVTSANDALQALNQSIPDLIISDIGMPEMDGYTLMTQIRALPQGKNLPAIALTAYAGETDQQRSLEAGFHKHLSKPINIPELIDTIIEILI